VFFPNKEVEEFIRNILRGNIIRWDQAIVAGKKRNPKFLFNEKKVFNGIKRQYLEASLTSQQQQQKKLYRDIHKALVTREVELDLVTELSFYVKKGSGNALERAHREYAWLTKVMAPQSRRGGRTQQRKRRFAILEELLTKYLGARKRLERVTLAGGTYNKEITLVKLAYARIRRFMGTGIVRTGGRLFFTGLDTEFESDIREQLKDELESSIQYLADSKISPPSLEFMKKISKDEKKHAKDLQGILSVKEIEKLTPPKNRKSVDEALVLNLMDELEGIQQYKTLLSKYKKHAFLIKKLIKSERKHAKKLFEVLLQSKEKVNVNVDMGTLCLGVLTKLTRDYLSNRKEFPINVMAASQAKLQKMAEGPGVTSSPLISAILNLDNLQYIIQMLQIIDRVKSAKSNREILMENPVEKTPHSVADFKRQINSLLGIYKRFLGEKSMNENSTIYKVTLYLLYSTENLLTL
jgi:rubrerythrin